MRGDRKINRYADWDGINGGGGCVSKRMFGTFDGAQFSFPAQDENGQERMKGWNSRQQRGRELLRCLSLGTHKKTLKSFRGKRKKESQQTSPAASQP